MNLLKIIKNFFHSEKKRKSHIEFHVHKICPYKRQIVDLLLSKESKMLGENLDEHLQRHFNPNIPVASSLISGSYSLQKVFTSFLYRQFYCKQEAINNLQLDSVSAVQLFEIVKLRVIDLYDLYKDYLASFVWFYQKNPGLSLVLKQYPVRMLSEPFYDFIKQDLACTDITEEQKTVLYLTLIHKMLSANYLEMNEQQRQILSISMKRFLNFSDKKVKNMARKTKRKVDEYAGFKCPGHLVFVSLLQEEKAEALAQFMLQRYFDPSTSLMSLKYALMGQLTILEEDKPWMGEMYRLNPLYSKSMKIKNRKRGYVCFVLESLLNRGLIITHKLWDSLSRARYFVNEDGSFIRRENFTSSSNGMRCQYSGANNKKIGKELKELVEVLNLLF